MRHPLGAHLLIKSRRILQYQGGPTHRPSGITSHHPYFLLVPPSTVSGNSREEQCPHCPLILILLQSSGHRVPGHMDASERDNTGFCSCDSQGAPTLQYCCVSRFLQDIKVQAGDSAQIVEHLPSMCETLFSAMTNWPYWCRSRIPPLRR